MKAEPTREDLENWLGGRTLVVGLSMYRLIVVKYGQEFADAHFKVGAPIPTSFTVSGPIEVYYTNPKLDKLIQEPWRGRRSRNGRRKK